MVLPLTNASQKALRQTLAEAGFPTNPATDIHASQLIQPGADRGRAIEAFREYLHRVPDDITAMENMAYLLQLVGQIGLSTQYRSRAITASVEQMELPEEQYESVLNFMLAKAGLANQPNACPRQLTIDKFDQYAENFDGHLRDTLEYLGPEKLIHRLQQLAEIRPKSLDVLDLGCGTGLSGERFAPLAKTLWGVDFSGGMLTKATQREIYDELIKADLVDALASMSRNFDLILAADVFIYIGDLKDAFEQVRNRLNKDGWFVFSVEKSISEYFLLQECGRYKHSLEYIESIAAASCLDVKHVSECVIRKEQGQAVIAYAFILQHAAS